MKNPLHYQLSEYDCGPTAVLNAVSFLFERDQIPPEVIRNIMLYCLDCYGTDGVSGKKGTSAVAMMFLSNWLDGFGKVGRLSVSSQYISGRSVYLGEDSLLNDAIRRRGVAVVRLFLDEWHYVLLTGLEDDRVMMFDPYYIDQPFEQKDIQMITDHPSEYNRIMPQSYLNCEEETLYAMGPVEGREAVLLFNEDIKLTPEKTIEYFI